jgi:hypothetical protein
MTIDLSKFKNAKSRVLSGREEGKKVRSKLKLDQLDKSAEKVTILIPSEIISLNSSFFLGLFGPSVRNLGEIGFEQKYIFSCSDVIMRSVKDGITRALKISNPLDF